ncbi:hypothetical protein [Nostoc sp. UIC 10630]|uniref:hypothetical protein n=1 Tax=Nostoc sp. UIC 10630 TaxID=2100146 RepID=UPI0013D7562A|nr:hypothetical protein [Nostoc sp. UIC 10630]NEU79863.1 hypothetical protein [Nostoc sp. UIC 10630]
MPVFPGMVFILQQLTQYGKQHFAQIGANFNLCMMRKLLIRLTQEIVLDFTARFCLAVLTKQKGTKDRL